ncbi:DUF4105 domain-containing protein [Carboxylicivirga sp. N1Y90]|uniref:lipoprotein N-acyltransferase Lnb domain-containing protein n=1 Tax=Carboxylicivirga fragile TaxID=3417571 RepID=UPI003D33E23A|nr:DUF4105 domain-containing protein [Marinilabiliaceae bacterium N1Y90]
MKRVLFLISIIFFSSNTFAAKQLSQEAKISLLTCSPGKGEVYTIYGHSAIRVKDDLYNIDSVFNYGTFDFNTPNFYLKFANGNLNYFLSVRSFKGFLQSYFHNEQSVWEQELNLSQEEKQKLFNALVLNTQPENRFYRYDFFFDNCATRIRDIVLDNIDGTVSYRDTTEKVSSFRSYIHEYEAKMPWVLQGLDILLGLKTDDPAYLHDQMFLPDYLMLYFSKALKHNGEEKVGLVKEMQPLLKFENNEDQNKAISPTLVFWLLLLVSLLILVYELRLRKKPLMIFNRIIFFVTGLVGVLILFLMFISHHAVTGENFNIMWALPTFLILAVLPLNRYRTNFIKYLLIFSLSTLFLFLAAWFIIPQQLPPMVFPIAILLFVRLALLYRYIFQQK